MESSAKIAKKFFNKNTVLFLSHGFDLKDLAQEMNIIAYKVSISYPNKPIEEQITIANKAMYRRIAVLLNFYSRGGIKVYPKELFRMDIDDSDTYLERALYLLKDAYKPKKIKQNLLTFTTNKEYDIIFKTAVLGYTLEEVSKEYHLTKSGVKYILDNALIRLKETYSFFQ